MEDVTEALNHHLLAVKQGSVCETGSSATMSDRGSAHRWILWLADTTTIRSTATSHSSGAIVSSRTRAQCIRIRLKSGC